MNETSVRTDYALDYGDEIDGPFSSRDEAAEYSRRIMEQAPFVEPGLYDHKLVKRTVTVIEGEWIDVDAAD